MRKCGYLNYLGGGPVVVECQSNQPPIIHALYWNIVQPTGGGVSTKIIADAMFIEVFDADRTGRELVGIKWIGDDSKLIGGENDIKRCKHGLELHCHGPIPPRPEIEGGTGGGTWSEVTPNTERGVVPSRRVAVAGAGRPTRSDEQR